MGRFIYEYKPIAEIIIMKFFLPCYKCPTSAHSMVVGTMDELGIKLETCKNGHESRYSILSSKYALLFEMGISCLISGHSREAVANFSSALERFYEFSIKVMLIKQGVAFEEIKETWKIVHRQSERQLGAFLFLYLQVFKKNPDVFSEKEKKLKTVRNDVIHNGHFVTEKEAEIFGNTVFEIIAKVLTDLKIGHIDEIGKVITKERNENIEPDLNFGFQTFLNITEPHKNFTQHINDLRKKSYGLVTFPLGGNVYIKHNDEMHMAYSEQGELKMVCLDQLTKKSDAL